MVKEPPHGRSLPRTIAAVPVLWSVQAPLLADAEFCAKCGTRVLKPPVANAVSTPAPVVQQTGQRGSCFQRGLWVLTILGALLGALIAFVGVVGASGSPQEASAAAIGIACAVVPYCLARAVSELGKS